MDRNQPENIEKNYPGNQDKQGVDKAPGEEQGKAEPVTNEDLKGKKVDADPEQESGKPTR